MLYRVGLADRDARVVLLEVLEADLEVELASTGDNVLARLLHRDLDHRVCARAFVDRGREGGGEREHGYMGQPRAAPRGEQAQARGLTAHI